MTTTQNSNVSGKGNMNRAINGGYGIAAVTVGDIWLKTALFVVTLAWGLFFALRLNVPPVTDEVGTVANTALLMGYDWSETEFSMGGYYFKYGFSLLYYPLMLLIKDSYMLYKSMLALNMVFMALIPVFLYDIMHRFIGSDKAESVMIAITAAVFPSSVLLMTYAKADVILLFLPFPILLLLLELGSLRTKGIEPALAKRNKRRRIWLSILTAALTMYAYMSHTRGIAIVLAVLCSVILIRIICRIPTVEYCSFIVTSVILYFVDRQVSAYFKNAIYGVYGTAYSSVESYDFEALKLIFTRDGFLSFAKIVIGTAFNVLASGYGLAAIAVLGGTVMILRYLKNRSYATDGEIILAVFSIMTFLGTFAMSCIYFFPYVHKYYIGEDIRRADWLIYGRYTACAAAVIEIFGLYLLIRRLKTGGAVLKFLSAGLYAAVTIAFFLKVAPYMEGVSTVTRYFIQLCTFVGLNGYGLTTAVIPDIGLALLKAGILGGIIGMLMIALSFIGDSERRLKAAFVTLVFIVASIAITVLNYNKIRISRDEVLKAWISEPCAVLEDLNGLAGEYPILVDTSAKGIKHYQFICKEFTVGSAETKTAEAANCFVVAKKKYFIKEYFKDDYYTFDSFDYTNATKDIVYIKGEELAQRLIGMGIPISKYTGKLKNTPVTDDAN